MKLYILPSMKRDNMKINSFHSLLFDQSKVEKPEINKNPKRNKDNFGTQNYLKNSIKKRNINDNLLNKSKSKPKTSKSSNNNSLNNSFIIKQNKKEKKTRKGNNIIKKKYPINERIKISSIKNNNHNGIKKVKHKESKIINGSFGYNKSKMENYNNGINLLNYKKIVHNFQNKNLNNIRNISVDSNQNLSNNNNSSTLISPIDHLFYRQITNISSLNKTNNHFINKISSNISPINNIHSNINIIKNNKNSNNLDVSCSFGKNKGIEKNILFHGKINENSYFQKNHSTLNIGKEKIKKHIDLDSNKNLEINYKKQIKKNFFQPKNIFHKFKPKKINNYK